MKQELEKLFYNSVMITRSNQECSELDFKVVYDTGRSSQVLIKHCGGMRNDCDLSPDKWIAKMEYLMNDYGFSKEQIDIIVAHEKLYQKGRTIGERSAIREVLEEIGTFAFRIEEIFTTFDLPADKKKIKKDFWHTKEYILPEYPYEIHRSRDKAIVGVAWVKSSELLTCHGRNSIIATHKRPTELVVQDQRISKEISIEVLEEFV